MAFTPNDVAANIATSKRSKLLDIIPERERYVDSLVLSLCRGEDVYTTRHMLVKQCDSQEVDLTIWNTTLPCMFRECAVIDKCGAEAMLAERFTNAGWNVINCSLAPIGVELRQTIEKRGLPCPSPNEHLYILRLHLTAVKKP
jgi:hypothetical protein